MRMKAMDEDGCYLYVNRCTLYRNYPIEAAEVNKCIATCNFNKLRWEKI